MERDFNKSKLVGNNAEIIVEYLINSMPNWECIKFGVENHIRELRKIVREHINPVTKNIKSMPDFVAFNKKTGETFFVEVKYRTKFNNLKTNEPEYNIDFLEEYKKYWAGTKLIIVQNCEPHFLVVNLDEIEDRMLKINSTSLKDYIYNWNFEEIKEDIKDIFPELEDEIIKESIKRISPKEDN